MNPYISSNENLCNTTHCTFNIYDVSRIQNNIARQLSSKRPHLNPKFTRLLKTGRIFCYFSFSPAMFIFIPAICATLTDEMIQRLSDFSSFSFCNLALFFLLSLVPLQAMHSRTAQRSHKSMVL